MKWFRRLFLSLATKKRFARAIAKCFDRVNWAAQSFTIGGSQFLTDKQGRDKFYACEDIDKAIRRLNRILRLLS